MSAPQSEFRVARMIERHVEPLRRAMAIGTNRTVHAVVGVVLAMTRDTLARRLTGELVAFVARLAREATVAACERKAGSYEVIE
jgi:hypothetical protein